ncbi:hypothetical protein DTO013E5_4262 [Penicillium roqueforti]|uniref:Genomic scaffold, ProqFM164S01 n=1 Tax=Penicillium roqueforti (strain FM164) TaxID=1365484 RepID=W6QBP8_PENRF|nr:uncharacterized protein LCP9604111_4248 [Penicillium roqueforti]CDM27077.1 unnamed protein product [Penicillium roqueforti FM164]KAF9249619.1 hypothetical protein LCP9604111_4248 [Penicillium roqueforti]KAI1835160.1 hypothetical protein CBS147337_3977 [Penicillium roqueforti]KAI2677173.1 hypothetical protein CBS147355_5400 [Penicillium roqueforti]KAI2688529.1 hypothetical protein LCP963914a_2931 [Penicillium roqueforti]
MFSISPRVNARAQTYNWLHQFSWSNYVSSVSTSYSVPTTINAASDPFYLNANGNQNIDYHFGPEATSNNKKPRSKHHCLFQIPVARFTNDHSLQPKTKSQLPHIHYRLG